VQVPFATAQRGWPRAHGWAVNGAPATDAVEAAATPPMQCWSCSSWCVQCGETKGHKYRDWRKLRTCRLHSTPRASAGRGTASCVKVPTGPASADARAAAHIPLRTRQQPEATTNNDTSLDRVAHVERRAIAPHRPNSLAQSSLKPQARSKACGPQNQASRRDGLARGGGSDQATAAAPHAMSGSLHAWLVRETLITHETRDVLSLI